ncbi:type II toxin-antitoxin system TacA family antitoxin [Rathayibacter sp. CAU 1779]
MAATKAHRLEVRTDAETYELIEEAADLLKQSKSAFVTDVVRQAALKVIARSDVTVMSAELFDAMMATLDVPDASEELADLATLPRRISR